VVTFSLPGGDIETRALNTLTNGGFSGTQAASITGGTGKYRHASGQLSINFLSPTEARSRASSEPGCRKPVRMSRGGALVG
jgi:hypothetical protein